MISDRDFRSQIAEIVSHPGNQEEWTVHLDPSTDVPYLIKRNHKLFIDDDVYNLEFHVVRHPTYCVPLLCFHAWGSDGATITDYNRIWSLFKLRLSQDAIQSLDMYSALTQIDHPVHQTPIWALHPCRTPELLQSFPADKTNLVLTFLSTFGPFLGLRLDHLAPT